MADGSKLYGVATIEGNLEVKNEPTFTYTDGKLTRIDYPTGYYKAMTYNADGTLNEVDYNGVFTKTMVWTDGALTGVTIG